MSKHAVEYSPEVAQALCLHLAEHGSITKACTEVGIARSSFYEWVRTQAGFHAMKETAREQYADSQFERLEQLLNEAPRIDKWDHVDHGWVALQRVKAENIRWMLSKLNPRRFSDRVELTGAEGGALIPPSEELTPERILDGARRLAFILHRADVLVREKPAAPLLLEHNVKAGAS